MRTQEFNSKLISLLPLDEVPVHVHPFAALAHQLAATPWGGSLPRPLCQKICYQTAQKTALCAPGSRSFDSKLISLPPLDEVTVHVHRFAARAPCDSKGSECQCGIHTAEAASALRSRKTER